MADSKAVRLIRGCADDETEFDLAGYNDAKVTELMKLCFEKPIERNSTLKVTLIVGGGKLVRQKYDDNLTKYVSAALKSIGYEDDKAADKSSQKAFKSQHDTNKNLKFVHVFPEIVAGQGKEYVEDDEEEEEEEEDVSIHDRILRVDCDELETVLPTRVPSYGEKKRLLQHLKDAQELFGQAEQKMINMKPLDGDEQTAFDTNNEIAEKITLVNTAIQTMVNEGKLTSKEKNQFLKEMEEKISGVKSQLDICSDDKKKKRFQMQLEKLEELHKAADSKDAMPARPLRRHDDIIKLYCKLYPRQELEASKGNKTVVQLQSIGEIPEIEEAIEAMLRGAKGWFEEEASFQERVKGVEAEAKKKARELAKKQKAKAASGYGWSTAKRR